MKSQLTSERHKEYLTLNPLLDSLYAEIKAFALKKQDGVLSKLKVIAINKVLERSKTLLDGENFYEFLEILDIDTLPSNSDVVMILAHYKMAMKNFYDTYTTHQGYGKYVWNIYEVESNDNEDDEYEYTDDD